MSYIEAKQDGVRAGRGAYYPPCRVCGREVYSKHYIRGYVYLCETCRPYRALLKKTGVIQKSVAN
jgi:hypothetical protein